MLENTKEAAVFAQQNYAHDKGIPWGISECAFAKVEENGAYGYRAFGVPQVAIQQDEDRLVVAPYATMLALAVDPAEAVRNLRWMTKKGWFGKYGYYESADFTRDVRPSRRQRFALVRSWMVHHQGMSLLAIANFLKGGIVQEWFSRDARVQATELLLQERPAGQVAGKPEKKRRGKAAKRKTRPVAVSKARVVVVRMWSNAGGVRLQAYISGAPGNCALAPEVRASVASAAKQAAEKSGQQGVVPPAEAGSGRQNKALNAALKRRTTRASTLKSVSVQHLRRWGILTRKSNESESY